MEDAIENCTLFIQCINRHIFAHESINLHELALLNENILSNNLSSV